MKKPITIKSTESVTPNKRTAVISGGIKGQRAARKFPNSPPKFIKLVKDSISELIRDEILSSNFRATEATKSAIPPSTLEIPSTILSQRLSPPLSSPPELPPSPPPSPEPSTSS